MLRVFSCSFYGVERDSSDCQEKEKQSIDIWRPPNLKVALPWLSLDCGLHVQTDLGSRDILSSLPTDILYAELNKRQNGTPKPSCGSEGISEDYNTGAHVFALFLILFLSTLGEIYNPTPPVQHTNVKQHAHSRWSRDVFRTFLSHITSSSSHDTSAQAFSSLPPSYTSFLQPSSPLQTHVFPTSGTSHILRWQAP